MPELLFLPGLAQDGHAYDLVELPGRAHVYPGHGERPPEAFSLLAIADEVAATITEPVDVVGVALGGIVAQHLLIRHPGLVRSAVLANTPSGVGDRSGLIARADEALRSGVDSMTDALVVRWFRPETIVADAEGVRYIHDVLSTMSPEGFAFTQRAMADHDTVALLPNVAAPVTLVRGVDDAVGPGSIELIHKLLPKSRLVEVPGSHMVHLDNPNGFRDVIIAHREWVEAGAPLDGAA